VSVPGHGRTTARPVAAAELVERGLELAGAHPENAGTSVVVREDSSANLRWASNTLTTNGVSTAQSVTVATAVRTPAGTCLGTVSRRGVGLDDLADLVAQARSVALTAPAAEDAAELVSGSAGDDFADAGEQTQASALTSVAEGLGEVLAEARDSGRELFGYAEHTLATTWLGTSGGVRRRHVQPNGTVELTGKSHGRSRSTYAAQAARDLSEVDVRQMAEQVTQRLEWQGRRTEMPAGRYDAVLPPSSVADLMIYLYWSSDARSAYEGRSVLSKRGGGTRVGEELTQLPLTLGSDPDHRGLECEPFVLTTQSSPFASVFDNGLSSPAVTWVDAGTLTALPTTRHTAAMTGLPVTPMVDNLLLSSPDGSGGVLDLVAGTERGLLLTSLWYIREVDPTTLLLTGLTRDGVYLVEGGEVVGAVNNFRFNESPVGMLRRVTGVGASQHTLSREWGEYFPRTSMPALRVRDFNFSSVSAAS
jgi:predicted Zn-dependent protease